MLLNLSRWLQRSAQTWWWAPPRGKSRALTPQHLMAGLPSPAWISKIRTRTSTWYNCFSGGTVFFTQPRPQCPNSHSELGLQYTVPLWNYKSSKSTTHPTYATNTTTKYTNKQMEQTNNNNHKPEFAFIGYTLFHMCWPISPVWSSPHGVWRGSWIKDSLIPET